MSNFRATNLLIVLLVVGLSPPALFAQEIPWTAQDNQDGGDPGLPAGVPTADIIFVPEDAAHAVCPPFGACPPGSQITDEYLGFGVDFSVFDGNPPVGVFSDPPDKFGGVNGGGNLDLLTDTCGRIVLTGSATQGATDLVIIEAGFVSGPNDILLEVYDLGGSVIGSSIADQGTGADGDLTAMVQLGASTIASFCVSTPTGDSHGVRRIHLNDPGAAVPTMSTATILGLGLVLAIVGSLYLRRRRQLV